MEQYSVTGMSCAACSSRVEKAVSQVEGVTSCSVSLLTNSMGVEGHASANAIIKAVEAAGYGAATKQKTEHETTSETPDYATILQDTETPKVKKRLIASLCMLIPLMYVSMGHMMWNWPLPKILEGNHIAMGLVQLLFAVAVMVVNQKFFINGFTGLVRGAPNMDTLVALGSAASFVYSVYALFAMTGAQVRGDVAAVMAYMHEFYFESAAMILTLITVGKMLEAMSKGKTTDALKSLMKLAPKTAVIIVDGKEQEVAIRQVKAGDVFVVRPGESIPVDGVVIEGSSAVNEAALTGESIPVDKAKGDTVSAATMNQSGFITCEAVRVGEDTTLSQIIQMVSDADATKAPIAKIADRVSGIFVPAVIIVAVITFIIWIIAGQDFGFTLARAISVLVISCPCALGLATPVAIMVGNGRGAKNGIMFKTALSLEETGKTQIAVLDKTGTITMGEPKVTDLYPMEGISKSELLQIAYSLEQKSEHPLAKAIVQAGEEKSCELLKVKEFKTAAGSGLSARIEDKIVVGGNYKYVRKAIWVGVDRMERLSQEESLNREESLNQAEMLANNLAEQGKTPLFFARDHKLLGVIAVADVIKKDSPKAIQELQNMGIHVVMLTGDNEKTARAIGAQVGVDEVVAGVLPAVKEEVVTALQRFGKVAMVGDGINDAPALTSANIGIAIGAGTDVAIDAADVVLMKNSLSDVPAAIRMSKATLQNIHENLFWAFFYNVIGIPLAAGLWIPIFGWTLNPMFGAAAMSLSSFCVVANALRLNLFKMQDATRDKKSRNALGATALLQENKYANASTEKDFDIDITTKKENHCMTIRVTGMMCGHCEAHVKKALEAIEGVKLAEADHKKGFVSVELEGEVSNEAITTAIVDAGYDVTGFED